MKRVSWKFIKRIHLNKKVFLIIYHLNLDDESEEESGDDDEEEEIEEEVDQSQLQSNVNYGKLI